MADVSEPWPTEASADMLIKCLESYPNERDTLRDISWTPIGILFAISVLLPAIAAYLTRYLSKERIVTTIP